MTKSERQAILQVVERIESLASLDNANFDINPEKDKFIKGEIRPYMCWFESTAYYLEKLATATDAISTKDAIDNILRYLQ